MVVEYSLCSPWSVDVWSSNVQLVMETKEQSRRVTRACDEAFQLDNGIDCCVGHLLVDTSVLARDLTNPSRPRVDEQCRGAR